MKQRKGTKSTKENTGKAFVLFVPFVANAFFDE